MAVEFTIDAKVDHWQAYFRALKKNAVKSAARKALNRTIRGAETFAVNMIKNKYYAFKTAKEVRKNIVRLNVIGNKLSNMQGKLIFTGKPINLIKFMKTRGAPPLPKQKGVKVKARKKLNVMVVPGKQRIMKKAFVVKGHGGKNRVFRRRGKERGPIVAQNVPSLASLIRRKQILPKLAQFAQKKMTHEFTSALNGQVQRVNAKFQNRVK